MCFRYTELNVFCAPWLLHACEVMVKSDARRDGQTDSDVQTDFERGRVFTANSRRAPCQQTRRRAEAGLNARRRSETRAGMKQGPKRGPNQTPRRASAAPRPAPQ